MRTVTVEEFARRTSGVLDEVTETNGVIVTERGTPRWQISAFRDQPSSLVRLAHTGRYTPPSSTPVPWPANPGGPKHSGPDVDALVGEIRGDH